MTMTETKLSDEEIQELIERLKGAQRAAVLCGLSNTKEICRAARRALRQLQAGNKSLMHAAGEVVELYENDLLRYGRSIDDVCLDMRNACNAAIDAALERQSEAKEGTSALYNRNRRGTMGDVDIVAIMRDMAEGRRNSCGDRWASSWCKDAANEIERLRAELADRDRYEESMYEELQGALDRGLGLEVAQINQHCQTVGWTPFDPETQKVRDWPVARYRVVPLAEPGLAEREGQRRPSYPWSSHLAHSSERTPIEAKADELTQAIEAMGAHPILTDAGSLAHEALCALGAWYEAGEPGKRPDADAELAERDKAVPVAEVTSTHEKFTKPKLLFAQGARERLNRGDKLYTHPPRQAVPDATIRSLLDAADDIEHAAQREGEMPVAQKRILQVRAAQIRDLLTAAPEARSETVTDINLMEWTPEGAVDFMGEKARSEGITVHDVEKAYGLQRSEAEIQAEALEAFGRKVWNEAEQWSKGMTKTALYNCAEWANAEAARLRSEGRE